jgi:hypothetical protein
MGVFLYMLPLVFLRSIGKKLLLFIWAYKEILSKLALTIGVDGRCRMRTLVFCRTVRRRVWCRVKGFDLWTGSTGSRFWFITRPLLFVYSCMSTYSYGACYVPSLLSGNWGQLRFLVLCGCHTLNWFSEYLTWIGVYLGYESQ